MSYKYLIFIFGLMGLQSCQLGAEFSDIEESPCGPYIWEMEHGLFSNNQIFNASTSENGLNLLFSDYSIFSLTPILPLKYIENGKSNSQGDAELLMITGDYEIEWQISQFDLSLNREFIVGLKYFSTNIYTFGMLGAVDTDRTNWFTDYYISLIS